MVVKKKLLESPPGATGRGWRSRRLMEKQWKSLCKINMFGFRVHKRQQKTILNQHFRFPIGHFGSSRFSGGRLLLLLVCYRSCCRSRRLSGISPSFPGGFRVFHSWNLHLPTNFHPRNRCFEMKRLMATSPNGRLPGIGAGTLLLVVVNLALIGWQQSFQEGTRATAVPVEAGEAEANQSFHHLIKTQSCVLPWTCLTRGRIDLASLGHLQFKNLTRLSKDTLANSLKFVRNLEKPGATSLSSTPLPPNSVRLSPAWKALPLNFVIGRKSWKNSLLASRMGYQQQPHRKPLTYNSSSAASQEFLLTLDPLYRRLQEEDPQMSLFPHKFAFKASSPSRQVGHNSSDKRKLREWERNSLTDYLRQSPICFSLAAYHFQLPYRFRCRWGEARVQAGR